ncbi:MAG: hypothetical protein Kow00124_20440 [Anaerolineae bacterium]
MLAVTAGHWPGLPPGSSFYDWWTAASLVALIALIYNLGVRTTFGEVTFLPVPILMAYLTMGIGPALLVNAAGVLLGGIVYSLRRLSQDREAPWWLLVGGLLGRFGIQALGLLAADWSYTALGAAPPLVAVESAAQALPIITAAVLYLIVENLALLLSLLLQGIPVIPTLVANRRTILGVGLLPLALAPFGALTRGRLGLSFFAFFETILGAMVVVVHMLVIAQESLHEQVAKLRSLSEVNDALRTSLELDQLLETVYIQLASLIRVRNLQVVIANPNSDGPPWQVAYEVRHGRRAPIDPQHAGIDHLARYVLEERKTLVTNRVEHTVEARKISKMLTQARAWMGIPLIASGRMIGGLFTWIGPGEQPGRSFTQADEEILIAIASQAGVALENALLYRAAQQSAAQMKRLNQINAMMTSSLNPERLLEVIAESVIEVLGCHKAAIYLMETDAEDPRLILAHARGFSPEHVVRSRDIAVPLTDEERQMVLVSGRPVTVPDVHAPGVRVSAAALLLAKDEGFGAYAYLPLRAQQRVIGMLAVYYEGPHHFPAEDVEMLETFANQAALAVSNARIYQQVDVQLTRRMGQIVRMADISQRLSATLDLQTIFNLIIDSAIEGCNATSGVLVLSGDPEMGRQDDTLNMVAWRGLDPASPTRAPHHIVQRLASSEIFSKGQTYLYSIDNPTFTGPNSHMSVPIFLDDRVIGAIAVESDVLNAFNQDDLAFISQLAVQAAVAIRNAQLYRSAQTVRDRLAAILDASNDGLLMIDTKSRIVMTNTRMSDFWDFARQDFRPRSPDQFMRDPLSALGEGLGYHEGELTDLLNRGLRNPNMPSRTDVYSTQVSEGRQRFVERTVTPVRDEMGSFIGLLLIFRDVTEQKELEEARRNLTELIVHDLRAPLQAVMGSMRLIEQVAPPDNSIIEQALNVSERAVKKLLNMVNNLLDLSRMERGELQVDTGVENVGALLEDVIKEMRPLAEDVDAVLQLDVEPNLPLALIDRDMIERVVLNLTDNALKYSPPGTLIRLRAYRSTSGSDPVDGRKSVIRVDVVDQGPGVPDEFKKAIWNRFAVIPGRKGRRPSAGLGLAFCRLAVESHNGKIWVEDNPEGGSIFAFTLPIAYVVDSGPPRLKPHPADNQPEDD